MKKSASLSNGTQTRAQKRAKAKEHARFVKKHRSNWKPGLRKSPMRQAETLEEMRKVLGLR